MKIVAFVPDLMDKSKFANVSNEVVFVRAADQLATNSETGDTVVGDLARPGVLDVLTELEGVRKVGFSSHVDTETIAAAQAGGVETYPRSRFFSHIVDILSKGAH